MPKRDPNKTEEQLKTEKEARNRKRLASMKDLLEANKVDDFKHLFDFYKISNVATAIHMGAGTLGKRMDNPASFKANEIQAIADLIGVDFDVMHRFWMAQVNRSKRP
jgi:hypothetical protein